MPATPRETVKKTILFEGAERIPFALDDRRGTDFANVGMAPFPDARPKSGIDEWGCIWKNIGISKMGEVAEFPLKDWSDLAKLKIPNIADPKRWESLEGARESAGDKFLLASGISLYERVHFLRGLENTWVDIYNAPDELGRLIDILVGMNVCAIEKYAEAGADGYIWCDDWGLQKGLMISPESWRAVWKPRYGRVYRACHDSGLMTFLHSCGDITSILDDFIEIGLDVIQMDQQENMGLDFLGKKFSGRITFWCPADIQSVMSGSADEIRQYCRRLAKTLGTPGGGFMAKYYSDPAGAGHAPEAVEAMCDEFFRLSKAIRK